MAKPKVAAVDKGTTEARMYTTFCSDFNLKPEWLGKTFTDHTGRVYTITGLNPRSKKHPVVTSDGTSFSAEYLIAVLTNTVDKLLQKSKAAHEKKFEAMLKTAAIQLPAMAKLYDIPAESLNKPFQYKRTTYTLIGWTDTKRRFPFIAKSASGQVMFFTSDGISELLGDKQAAKERAARRSVPIDVRDVVPSPTL
jgi:hypothetical protein